MSAIGVTLNVRLDGYEKIDKWLKRLGPKLAKKITRKAMREGAKVIAKEAGLLVPVDTGKLKKEITKVRVVKKRKRGWIRFRAGTDDAFYGQWIELGYFKRPVVYNPVTKRFYSAGRNPRAKKGGERPEPKDATWVPPRPFLRPAFERKQQAAIDRISQIYKREIEINWGKTANVSEGKDGAAA